MELLIGIIFVIAAGACEGLFSLPVTRTPNWRWENIWGLGSLIALLLVPWPMAFLTVPQLREVYAEVGSGLVILTLLFGAGWGLGGIFWGKAIAALGMALGVSLLMGLINVFGSPVPLAIKEPGKLIQPGGLMLLLAVAVMILGVVFCSLAGKRKEQELVGEQPAEGRPAAGTPFMLGLLFCVLSGMLSAMVNCGFIFGEPLAIAAKNAGASDFGKYNAIWALVFTSNYAVNAAYACYLMLKNRTWGLLISQGTPGYWAGAIFMGIAWPLGIVLYGIGAGKMGTYGAFVGFPMMLVMAILFGNLAGALQGEWQGTSARTRATMLLGVAVLIVSFVVFSFAELLLG